MKQNGSDLFPIIYYYSKDIGEQLVSMTHVTI